MNRPWLPLVLALLELRDRGFDAFDSRMSIDEIRRSDQYDSDLFVELTPAQSSAGQLDLICRRDVRHQNVTVAPTGGAIGTFRAALEFALPVNSVVEQITTVAR